MQTGKCKACGTESPPEERFCPECGCDLGAAGDHVSLWFREGTSDKVYHIHIDRDGDDTYTVRARWGRRGRQHLEEQVKAQGVPLARAQAVYDELLRSKIKKGYREATGQV